MKILFCGSGWLDFAAMLRERLAPEHTLEVRDPARPLVVQVGDADVLLPSNARVDAEVLGAARRVVLVQQPAAGYEGIDLAAARARGVPVCNAPGPNANAVAEAALFMMLALARRLPAARAAFERREIGRPIGTELAGKTLGIVGLGRTGGRLAELARALGMRVVSVGRAEGRAGLHAMLGVADVVSIHCPLSPETRGLFDDAAFAATKRGALLVSSARGAIVDRGALERALGSGRLGGVALDVHWDEPWDPRDPLYAREDVVALPHIAGSTREAFDALAEVIRENVDRVARGEEPRFRVA